MSKQKLDWETITIATVVVALIVLCVTCGIIDANKPKNYKDDYHYQRQLMELKAEQDFKKMQEGKLK